MASITGGHCLCPSDRHGKAVYSRLGLVRYDTLGLGPIRRSRFGALWDGSLRFVGFGYGGHGMERFVMMRFVRVRFGQTVEARNVAFR